MILVDSSVWIDYFNGVNNRAASKLDTVLGQEFLAIGDLNSSQHRTRRRLLVALPRHRPDQTVPECPLGLIKRLRDRAEQDGSKRLVLHRRDLASPQRVHKFKIPPQ